MRLFTGIALSEAWAKQLADLIMNQPYQKGLRWTALQNLHITVFFMGERSPGSIEGIREQIRRAVKPISAFDLSFDLIGPAPKRNPRMIWAKFKQSEMFYQLVDGLSVHLSGESANRGRTIPHITLARGKGDFSSFHLPAAQPFDHIPELPVNEIILWQSILESGKAPTYIPIETFGLKK